MSESRALAPIEVVCHALTSPQLRANIQQALPPDVNIDRFTRTTLTALQAKPELAEADRQSLYNSIVRAAQDGLMPDGRQGAITVFNTNVGTKDKPKWIKKCQWMPMVEGCIHKLTKAGVMAYAVSVYANDDIELWNDDTGQHVKHRPVVFGDRGERVGAYAVGRVIATGAVYIEAMNMEDLAKARKASKSPDKGPWADWTDRMEQKSALHRLDKRIGTSALTDEDYEDSTPVAPVVAEPPSATPSKATGRPRALQAVVDQTSPPAEATDAPAKVPEGSGGDTGEEVF